MRRQMEQQDGPSAWPPAPPLRMCSRRRLDGSDAWWLQAGPAGDACGIPQESHWVPWGAQRCVLRVELGTRPLPCLAGVANTQTNLIFPHAGVRVLADDNPHAFWVR